MDRQERSGPGSLRERLFLLGELTFRPACFERYDAETDRCRAQVDAGGFRDASVTHTFHELPSVLSSLYSTLPSDTIMLAATLGPFESGTEWVKDVKRTDEMDRTDRLQGGWFGGKKEAVQMWEREVQKVTVMQSALQRCVILGRSFRAAVLTDAGLARARAALPLRSSRSGRWPLD